MHTLSTVQKKKLSTSGNTRPAEDAKDKEIESLKAALKQIAEIANRRVHLTVVTWKKYAWYELAKIAKEALANDTNTGKMEG
jgi:signal transduction histidine kinase